MSNLNKVPLFVLVLTAFLSATVKANYGMQRSTASYDFDNPYNQPQPSYGYNPYKFGYDIEDSYGNKQWRQEKSSQPHAVHGSYGYRDSNGIYREVYYIADKDGFRANIKTNEHGVASKDSASVRVETFGNGMQPAASQLHATRASYQPYTSYKPYTMQPQYTPSY